MIPGVINLPLTSTTVAPAGLGIFDDGPMSRMRPFSITIVTSLWGSAPVPSMTVAWLSTVTCAVAVPVNNSAAARIKRVFDPFIWIPPLYAGNNWLRWCRDRGDISQQRFLLSNGTISANPQPQARPLRLSTVIVQIARGPRQVIA